MAETEGVVDVADVVESVDHEATVDAPAPAPVPETTQAIDLDELVGSGGSGVPPGVDSLSAPLDEDAFIDAYTPLAPVEAAVVEPKEEDPRVAWRKKNQDALRAKDVEEAKTKKANAEKAQAHLKKVLEARTKSLSARKETNRNTQKGLSPESGVPKEGTAWEKVNGLVNFSQGTHAKDVTRFKTTLISLKTVKA